MVRSNPISSFSFNILTISLISISFSFIFHLPFGMFFLWEDNNTTKMENKYTSLENHI